MWNSSHFILSDNDPEIRWNEKKQYSNNNIHDGQRKLCLTLIQFLTEFINVENPVVVYIGAASGSNIIVAMELFPSIVWHLYDTNPFDDRLKNRKNVIIYNQYFTDKESDEWSKKQRDDKNVYFISDIRRETGDMKLIMEDMDIQEKWYKNIKPNSGSLKFRLPYINEGDEDIKINYLDGFIFKQPWSPKYSTETRLIPFDGERMKEYSSLSYESKMLHHNLIYRRKIYSFYDNEYTFDKMCEFAIIYNYIYKKLKNTRPTNEIIQRYSEYISTVIRKPTPF